MPPLHATRAGRALPCVSDLPGLVPSHHLDPANDSGDSDELTSTQSLGGARVDVAYEIGRGGVTVIGAYVNGELVDADEFASSAVDAWERAIEKGRDL